VKKAPGLGIAIAVACAAIVLPAATNAADSASDPAASGNNDAGASQATHRRAQKRPAKRIAFRKYVACDTVSEVEPSRSCRLGDEKGAFFRSNLFNVRYHVCVRFPDRRSMCAKRQEAKRGELYVNRITSRMTGVHAVVWFVKGKRVGRYRFRVTR